ncbi:pollen receptor-like kinase 3 [Curcuma longa]|uniref:pollen receptor-like kinase 3 n=1 Tax=Curcuma longa TaxID=136217 RepID=UPI003D9F72D6
MVFLHRRPRRHCVLLLLVLLQVLTPACFSDDTASPETAALLLLKNSFTNATNLSSWTNSTGGPCDSRWDGVICQKGSVAGLDLAGEGLSGAIDVDALAQLANLRTVSFADNNFSGRIPALNRLHALRAIYLSRNRFAGDIPGDFFDSMTRLKKLCINDNDFTGLIPYSLSKASGMMELQLQNNHFTGTIPALVLPSLSAFNVSNNELEGVIPDVYSKFNASSFLGNENLCGEAQFGDLQPCKEEEEASNGKVAAIFMLVVFLICLVVYLITTREQKGEEPMDLDAMNDEKGMEAAKEVRFRRVQSAAKEEEVGQSRRMSSAENGGGGGGAGDLVMVNEAKGVFGLPELMKASAEVMGGGGMGSAYKAVMTSGVAVVVKRMRDMNRMGKEAFDGHLRRLGSLNHPNLLPPLAYHYRKDEKLFVYEYIPKGSLLYVLHGDRGLDHASLDWPTRVKIAKGVARGLSHLHAEFPSDDAAAAPQHGNLKSSNVLLAPDFEPLLVDYGFLPLLNPAAMTMQAHRAPEVAGGGGPATSRSDVFCLGVVLLELLTGKFPSQYLGEGAKAGGGGTDVVHWATYAVGEGREAEILDPTIVAGPHAAVWVPEMKRLVRVGVDCSAAEPERRIELREAVARIEEVAAGVRDGAGERPS